MPMRPQTVGDLKKNLEKYPDSMPLVTASDSEGNSFDYVYYTPTPGKFDGQDFVSDTEEKDAEFKTKLKGKKVLCIN